MIYDILDLGMQPIANGFLNEEDFINEPFYHLVATYDTETYHFSIKNTVEPTDMFNSNYAYFSSNSKPMISHFKETSDILKLYNPNSILEIGSNDGCFIKNFETTNSVCVEPSSNLSSITENLGYTTYTKFFGRDVVKELLDNHGKFDLIYSANCICHIPDIDEVFESISKLISDGGLFVFEDPSLLNMIQNNSYDQIYDEHPHIFSILFISKIAEKYGLEVKKVESLSVHGGSNRIYVGNKNGIGIDESVKITLDIEIKNGLNDINSIRLFADRVEQSKKDLISILTNIKKSGKKVLSYGATSKSTTIFNYCGINSDLIDIISDNSETKIGKFSPGMHIPIKNRNDININDYEYIFLGAWNFKDFILNLEKDWISKGGKIITHVPKVDII